MKSAEPQNKLPVIGSKPAATGTKESVMNSALGPLKHLFRPRTKSSAENEAAEVSKAQQEYPDNPATTAGNTNATPIVEKIATASPADNKKAPEPAAVVSSGNNNSKESVTTPSANPFESNVEIDLATINFHAVLSSIKVHMVVTTELDYDHNIALHTFLGEVSDEQLMAEMAERGLSYNSRLSLDYDMAGHKRAASLPLQASTDDEILAEVKHRKLYLHEFIDESVVRETYDFDKVLGNGASGKVYLCRHKANQHYFACKVIHKDPKMNDAQSMSTEMEIMKRLRHRNIVGVYEIFESAESLWLILELVNGGDLRGYIESHRQMYNEALCAGQMKQVLLGIHHIHSKGVVHRDVKLENILMKKVAMNPSVYEVRIADFGLSAIVRLGEHGYDLSRSSKRKLYKNLHEPWGTAEYEAPELLTGSYGPQVDLWAAGCIMYEMISGTKAFYRRKDDKSIDMLYSRIRKGEYNFNDGVWWQVSADCKHLISSLIEKDPSKRLTATDALKHKWIVQHTGPATIS